MSLKELRNRIQSIKSIYSIAEAMRLISVSRFAQLKKHALSIVPYTDEIHKTFSHITTSLSLELPDYPWTSDFKLFAQIIEENKVLDRSADIQQYIGNTDISNFFKKNNLSSLVEKKSDNYDEVIILLTSDKGLCGQFNGAAIKELKRYLEREVNNKNRIGIICIGTKGYDAFKGYTAFSKKNKKIEIIATAKMPSIKLCSFFSVLLYFTDYIFGYLSKNKVRSCKIFYTHFISLLKNKSNFFPIVPFTNINHFVNIKSDLASALKYKSSSNNTREFGENEKNRVLFDDSFDPSKELVIAGIAREIWYLTIYNALLSNMLCEHSCRISAMDNASKNSKDIIDKLILKSNMIRQDMITNELSEIISGSEAA